MKQYIVTSKSGKLAQFDYDDVTVLPDEELAIEFAKYMASAGYHVTVTLEILVIDGRRHKSK